MSAAPGIMASAISGRFVEALSMMRFKREVTCPFCGYHGEMQRKSRGSALVGVLLLLFGVAPGLLYFAMMKGYHYYCRQCGWPIASDA